MQLQAKQLIYSIGMAKKPTHKKHNKFRHKEAENDFHSPCLHLLFMSNTLCQKHIWDSLGKVSDRILMQVILFLGHTHLPLYYSILPTGIMTESRDENCVTLTWRFIKTPHFSIFSLPNPEVKAHRMTLTIGKLNKQHHILNV